MNVETAASEIISTIDSPAARLQALFKRNKASEVANRLKEERDFYNNADTELLAQEISKQEAREQQPLRERLMQGVKQQIEKDNASILQAAIRKRNPYIQYQDYKNVLKEEQEAQAAQAAKTLQNAIRNNKTREKIKEELLDMQDNRFFYAAAKEYKVPILQAAFKRRPQREIYSYTIQLARDRQGLEARQQEAAAQRQADAARNIQKIFRGSEGRKIARDAAAAAQRQQQQARQDTFNDYREFAREEAQAAAQKQRIEKRKTERQLSNKALAKGQQQQQNKEDEEKLKKNENFMIKKILNY